MFHFPRTAELIGPEFEGNYKWGGAAVDREGIVWGIPSDATCVLRVDPLTSEVSSFGGEEQALGSLQNNSTANVEGGSPRASMIEGGALVEYIRPNQ